MWPGAESNSHPRAERFPARLRPIVRLGDRVLPAESAKIGDHPTRRSRSASQRAARSSRTDRDRADEQNHSNQQPHH